MTLTTSDRKLTYADYVRIPDDGRRHEIVDGVTVRLAEIWSAV